MDLGRIKCKLTEGYERINKMKYSTSELEACRTRLKAKEKKTLVEVKTVMRNISEKLRQIQLSIEKTITSSVAHCEKQLDAQKEKIHDEYANLVKVCVEADKVLRGENVELLGNSCQHLFCKFEDANVRLDAAEKLDENGVIDFELKDNTQNFLSNACLARLKLFSRCGMVSEIHEIWVKYHRTDGIMDKTKKMYTDATSNYNDCSSMRPVTIRRFPDRSTGFSQKKLLETIQEVPEDSNPSKIEDIKSKPQSAPEVVHIREADLCTGICHSQNCFEESKSIPPPPGFSKLMEPRLQMDSSIQQYALVQNIGFAINSKSKSSTNPPSDSDDHFTNGHCEGSELEKLSRSCSHFAYRCQNGPSCVGCVPARTYPSSLQNLEVGQKLRDRMVTKSAERYGDPDNFFWDSDDSVDFLNPMPCSRAAHMKGGDRSKLTSGLSGKSFQIEPVVHMLQVQKAACLDLDRKCDSLCHLYVPEIGFHGQLSTKLGDCVKENHHRSQKENGQYPELEQLGHQGGREDKKQEVEQTCEKQEGGVVKQKDKIDAKQEGNEVVSQTVQTDTKHEGNEFINKKFQTDIKQEMDDINRKGRQEFVSQTIMKEDEIVFVKTTRDSCSVRKSAVEIMKDHEGASPRATEIPHPLKTRRRLDLSCMLQHIRGGHYVIDAKCIERICGDFDHPIGVCTNSKGDVIIADTSNHIVKLCKNGQVVSTIGQALKMRRPSAVVVNIRDEIFVKDDYMLYHFDAEGQFIKTMGRRQMNAPYGLGMTKDGKLIVVDQFSNGRMHVFQQDGAIDTFPYQPLQNQLVNSKCRFLAVHGNDVLTSDLGLSCLYLTNQMGELYKTLGQRGKLCGELHEPAGIAVDSVGNWVVADSKNHRVQVFDQNGYFMAMVNFIGDSIRRPSGIHLTCDGLLYVINYLDSVIKVFKLGAS